MILYRIKRISTGKYFVGNSVAGIAVCDSIYFPGVPPYSQYYPWWPHQFGKTGAFYKGIQTIRKHIHNLCHDWEQNPIGYYDRYKTLGEPKWKRLEDLEVEIITIIDHGEKTQPARDFMGILETLGEENV